MRERKRERERENKATTEGADGEWEGELPEGVRDRREGTPAIVWEMETGTEWKGCEQWESK